MRETAIIITNYNGYSDTKKCLESIKNSIYKDYFVVVVDDCSPNLENILDIDKEFSDIDIVVTQTKNNLGFAGANNWGINFAQEFSPRYYMLLNNDATVDEYTISRLIDEADATNIVGPCIFKMNDPNIVWSAGGEIGEQDGVPYNIGNGMELSEEYLEKRDVRFLSFCCVLFSAEILEQVGQLDESLYMYSEDVDFCLRASRKNIKCIYCPEAVVFHKDGGSGVSKSLQGLYYGMRNECYIRERYLRVGRKMNLRLLNRLTLSYIVKTMLGCCNDINYYRYRAVKDWKDGVSGKSFSRRKIDE